MMSCRECPRHLFHLRFYSDTRVLPLYLIDILIWLGFRDLGYLTVIIGSNNNFSSPAQLLGQIDSRPLMMEVKEPSKRTLSLRISGTGWVRKFEARTTRFMEIIMSLFSWWADISFNVMRASRYVSCAIFSIWRISTNFGIARSKTARYTYKCSIVRANNSQII